MFKPLRWLLQGFLITAPVLLTIYLVWALYRYFNNGLFQPIALLLEPVLGTPIPEWLVAPVGLVLTLLIIMTIGLLAGHFLGRQLFSLVDNIMERLPLVKLLYGAIKDVLGAITGQDKRFSKPVLVRINADIEVIGFVTRDSLDEMGLEGRVAVYLPQSFNFAGNLVLVAKDKVTPLNMTAAEVLPLVVAGGVSKQGNGDSSRQGL
ncbi:MAG: DUF502 domain-containing protein [Pseudomonadota bacterium]|uniref:DUF502 domain-containing protein n=1 Tax=Gallaecimonas pentaromativorans TaxID=584787 RepID=UPI00067EC50D|nr:DUF502 domain-containing protein [Gallaecimonas pentaromativorans]MED5525780.1 DUF502 domain-containing protein [Pseudomonadota bacterium]